MDMFSRCSRTMLRRAQHETNHVVPTEQVTVAVPIQTCITEITMANYPDNESSTRERAALLGGSAHGKVSAITEDRKPQILKSKRGFDPGTTAPDGLRPTSFSSR